MERGNCAKGIALGAREWTAGDERLWDKKSASLGALLRGMYDIGEPALRLLFNISRSFGPAICSIYILEKNFDSRMYINYASFAERLSLGVKFSFAVTLVYLS